MKSITILIPCYNEEFGIHLLYNRLKNLSSSLQDYQVKLLFVDDHHYYLLKLLNKIECL